MARTPSIRWHDRAAAWRSDIGPVSEKSGRRTPVYFRDIPKNQPARARAALEAYFGEREDRLVSGGEWTLDDLRLLYLSHSRKTSEPNTYGGHRKALAKVVAFRGSGRPYGATLSRDFTATDLDRAVRAWLDAGHSPTYVVRL